MPENKNQHFIPQFYLKNFSTNKTLGIYNLKTRSTYRRSYRKICAKEYFYSKDTELEKLYGTLESRHSNVISELIMLQDLDKLPYEKFIDLLSFVTFQRSRANREKLNSKIYVNSLTEVLKYAVSLDSKSGHTQITKDQIEDIKITWNAHKFKMGYEILLGPLLISDLESCILLNRTDNNFIFSDEPVIFYNGCFNNTGYSVTGLQSPGLQIFCPINKYLILFLYDCRYYNLNNMKKIELYSTEDVDFINRLQIFNAYETLFFTDDKDRDLIKKLHSQVEYLLENERNRMEMISSDNRKDESKLFCFSARE